MSKIKKGKFQLELTFFVIQKEKQASMMLVFAGGEGPQPNQDVRSNPTIHYIPYEIVMERTKEYNT